MAAIDNLIEKISDPGLKQDISREVARIKQQKKFGLVFEEHLPEATPLYDVPIKKKSLVAEKDVASSVRGQGCAKWSSSEESSGAEGPYV